jgi:hypothetical protein
MIIAAVYSFNNGEEVVNQKYPELLKEVNAIIKNVKADEHLTKKSKEKTMPGKMLYSPKSLNQAFKKEFYDLNWHNRRVKCQYPTQFYTKDYTPESIKGKTFREMDFLKEKLGIELQLGKYSFMVYNVCAKMTIFRNLGFIDAGIEIVPIKSLADKMSTGVSYFEQFVWDLENRGISNIDIPVLIFGIAK